MKYGVLFCIAAVLCIQLHAQPQARTGATRNTIYVSGGTRITFVSASFGYERLLIVNPAFQLAARANIGTYMKIMVDEGAFVSSSLVTLHGKRYHLSETGLGACLFRSQFGFAKEENGVYTEVPYKWYPAVYMGYRYKNPRKHYMFKAGVGWPEQISAGIGISF